MAPNLALPTLEFIHDMILSNKLSPSKITKAADCHPSTITGHIANIGLFRNVKVPAIKHRRPRCLIPEIIKALCDYLPGNPYLYLDKMAIFLWHEFQV
jgi:hypothetical protein